MNVAQLERTERRRRRRRRSNGVAAIAPLADAPLRRWVRRAMVGDLVAGVLAAALAMFVRFGFDDAPLAGVGWRVSYLFVGAAVAVVWPLVNALAGTYDYRVALFGVEEVRRLLRSALWLLATAAIVNLALGIEASRGYMAVLLVALVGFTLAWRLVLRRAVNREHRAGTGRHRAVAVGPLEELQRMCLELQSRPGTPIDLVAYVADDLEDDEPAPPPLGRLRRLRDRDAVDHLRADGLTVDLLLRAGQPGADELYRLARQAHEQNVGLGVAPSRRQHVNVAFSYVPFASTPLMLVETPSLTPANRVTKAVFDRVVGAVLLLAVSPVLLACAIAILVTDGRPVLFRQERVGRERKPFRVWKFRTMVVGAEGLLCDLQKQNDADGPLFKLRDDPRVTRVGAWLRRRSLDELPQLLNVVAGDMSLVGPRPPLLHEAATYDERTSRRLLVKPGMTGLWQVSGRSDLDWDESVYLDLMYVDRWSPLLDLAIMARTVRAMLRPRGAY